MEEKRTEYIDEEGNKVVIVGKTTFVYKKMSDVEKAIELSEMREKALHIEATEKAHARAEGRAEGERRKEAEILAKMRKSGLSEEQIKAILNS
jgi:hypothetical protein